MYISAIALDREPWHGSVAMPGYLPVHRKTSANKLMSKATDLGLSFSLLSRTWGKLSGCENPGDHKMLAIWFAKMSQLHKEVESMGWQLKRKCQIRKGMPEASWTLSRCHCPDRNPMCQPHPAIGLKRITFLTFSFCGRALCPGSSRCSLL